MNFEQLQQEPTADNNEKSGPSKLDRAKRFLKKSATLAGLGATLLSEESYADEGKEKAPPKGPDPMVEKANTDGSKIESSEHTAETLLMSFLGAMSRDRLEKSPDGAVFLELDFKFYKLDSSDLMRLRKFVLQSKFPSIYTNYFDLPTILRKGRGLALEYRIQLDISKNCKPIEDPSILPPKMRARFEEVRGIDFIKLRKNLGIKEQGIKSSPTEGVTNKILPKTNTLKENTPKNKPFISEADDF